MEPRLSHLEGRVDRVEIKLDTIIERLSALASKADMRNYLLTAVGLFIALIALFLTGMGWLETRATRVETSPPPPTVVVIPAPVIAPASAKAWAPPDLPITNGTR
jgi:hypothetical protein